MNRKLWIVGAGMFACAYAFGAHAAHAQGTPPQASQGEQQQAQPEQAPAQPSEAAAPLQPGDAGVGAPPAEAAPSADAGTQLEAARGEAPVSPESFIGEGVGVLEGAAAPAEVGEPALPAPRGRPSGQTTHRAPKKLQAAPPLVVWATAGLGNALGPARCEKQTLAGLAPAIHIASTMKHSVAVAGVGFAPAGALSDHPLLEHVAEHEPERLASWVAAAGFSVIAVGAADLSGPLMRFPKLSEALIRRGVMPVASNLHCNGQAFCRHWATAEKPLHVVERAGQRYVFISFLPDDTSMRVEPARGELVLQPLTEAWVKRTQEARGLSAQLIVSSIDHGPDATAAARVADLLAELPAQPRPELLLSPSSGENLLFMRPLDVQPAVVGTRRGVLTGIRVTKLQGGRDADVLARGVRLYDWDDALAAELAEMAASYCRSEQRDLAGGKLELPMAYEGLVPLAAAAARELADADVAVVDPLTFDPRFARPDGAHLQRGEIERAVLSDAPLVTANVTLDWLGQLSRNVDGLRPLHLTNYSVDGKFVFVAGREAVVGATYRVVTTSVLARSDRLPGGAVFQPLNEPDATLRGALLTHLNQQSAEDPRRRVENLALGTQWVLRTDGQLFGNLTETYNSKDERLRYDEPALKADDSSQLGVRFVLNFDADAPKFLFENAVNVAFDRNFAANKTALDLSFIQSSYTYRGLWPEPLLYPHPFVEMYAETQLEKFADPLLLRPKLGVRSMLSRVASFKAYAGIQYTIPSADPLPGMGAEFQLKPWTIVAANGSMQIEGNVTYFWSSPGNKDQHILRAQLISSYQLIGPLQLTLTALGALRKDGDKDYYGRAVGFQAGVRLRFVTRDMSD